MPRIKRRLAHLTAALVLVFGLAAVPLETPFGGLFGPASASAACNNFTIYAGGNQDSWAWASCADDANLSGNSNGINPLNPCQLVPFRSDWDNCLSSVSANFTGQTQACLWSDTNYSGNGLKVNPGSVGAWNMPSWLNDAVSSRELATSDCFANGNQS